MAKASWDDFQAYEGYFSPLDVAEHFDPTHEESAWFEIWEHAYCNAVVGVLSGTLERITEKQARDLTGPAIDRWSDVS